jgi:hypothetical protein
VGLRQVNEEEHEEEHEEEQLVTEFQGLGAFSSDITKPVYNWALAPKVMNFLSGGPLRAV